MLTFPLTIPRKFNNSQIIEKKSLFFLPSSFSWSLSPSQLLFHLPRTNTRVYYQEPFLSSKNRFSLNSLHFFSHFFSRILDALFKNHFKAFLY